jgi:hypothetical protein
VEGLANDLKSGRLDPAKVPQIRVFWEGDKLCTLANRRLSAFQRADKAIPYRMATPKEITQERSRKMDTRTDGTSIIQRGVK